MISSINLLRDSKRTDVTVFSTFFFTKLDVLYDNFNYSAVARWTKNVDIFQQYLVLIPVHLSDHWILIAVNMSDNVISVYDSMKKSYSECDKLVSEYTLKYLEEESIAKKKKKLERTKWTIKIVDCKQQLNEYDCGVHVLCNGFLLLNNDDNKLCE